MCGYAALRDEFVAIHHRFFPMYSDGYRNGSQDKVNRSRCFNLNIEFLHPLSQTNKNANAIFHLNVLYSCYECDDYCGQAALHATEPRASLHSVTQIFANTKYTNNIYAEMCAYA